MDLLTPSHLCTCYTLLDHDTLIPYYYLQTTMKNLFYLQADFVRQKKIENTFRNDIFSVRHGF